MKYKTEQESFWAGNFGSEYIKRNEDIDSIKNNIALFCKALRNTKKIETCIEFGANIGKNLKALKVIYPEISQYAIEINNDAISELCSFLPQKNVFHQSILDYSPTKKFDLVLVKGVLIHINPEYLNRVYDLLYKSTRHYLLLCEYYNPTPTEVNYRGYNERLFKRDFCGEIMDTYSDLMLLDYGFVYHRDSNFPQDDMNWFLLEKRN